MTAKTIGDLTAAGTITGAETLEIEQAGNSRKVEADTLLARVVAVLDSVLGSTAWRSAAPVTSVAGLTGIVSAAGLRTALNVADGADVSPVASVAGLTGAISAASLRTAINVEDGATADQTGAEIATLLDALLGTSAWRTAAVASVGGQTGTVAVSALRGGVRVVTGDTTVLAGDNSGWIVCNGTLTVTIPTGLTAPFSVAVLNIGSDTVTIAGSGLTVNKRADQALTIATQYAQAVLVSWASDSWAATGGLDAS